MWKMKTTIKVSKAIVSAIALVFICTGCLLSDLDEGHVETRFDSGLRTMDAGDYVTAKKMFYEAYQRTDSYGVQSWLKAACAYNFAICEGQLGNFEQAENWFNESIALDEKVEGKDGPHASMRLFELARLYQAWGKNSQSIEMYEKAFLLADKQNALKTDPIGYAIVLNDYATVLKKADFEQKAESIENKAQKIRDANPGVEPKFKVRYYPTK
jgi:tetratricopeptide (TPR) repeat protein